MLISPTIALYMMYIHIGDLYMVKLIMKLKLNITNCKPELLSIIHTY